jgi:hypothetical protein
MRGALRNEVGVASSRDDFLVLYYYTTLVDQKLKPPQDVRSMYCSVCGLDWELLVLIRGQNWSTANPKKLG